MVESFQHGYLNHYFSKQVSVDSVNFINSIYSLAFPMVIIVTPLLFLKSGFRLYIMIMLLILSCINIAHAQNNPVELGDVHWLRDISKAQEQSKVSGKPIFVLFQEIPGCVTCQKYGAEVMSHPLIVDAIENEFIPLAIYNNKKGDDARVLSYFNEPSWNNPVARVVNANLTDVLPRLDGGYTPAVITNYLIKAMDLTNKKIPAYLDLLIKSFSESTQSVTFGMQCFWEGESKLGALPGVIKTNPGFMDGHEVVEVEFDPRYISPEKLIFEAGKQECSNQIYAYQKHLLQYQRINSKTKERKRFISDKDPQYYLKHSAFKFVPMLPIQASKINSAVAVGQSPVVYLSPRQIEIYSYFNLNAGGHVNAYTSLDFFKVFNEAIKKIKTGKGMEKS